VIAVKILRKFHRIFGIIEKTEKRADNSD